MSRTGFYNAAFNIINTFILSFMVIIAFYPFLYIIFYSISDTRYLTGGLMLYPKGFSLLTFRESIINANISRGLLVSVARSTLGPVVTLLVTSMTAFVLTKQKLAGHKYFMIFFLFTMYVSSGLIPWYVLIISLHLNGTFWVYILPYVINAFYLILIKTYIEGIPADLEEAAIIDGANEFMVFVRVIFPVCIPISAAVLLFECINQWNMFQDTLFFNAQTESMHTVQFILVNFLQNRVSNIQQLQMLNGGVKLPTMSLRMAMTVITVIPIAIVYPFLQRYFIKGLLLGAIKG